MLTGAKPLDPHGVERMVEVALGKRPADTVIRGARLVNVFTEQVEEPGAVALAEGRVASLGPELPGWVGADTKIFEVQGQYLLPGLIDAHNHLDAIFLLGAYASLTLPRGNTTAITETGMIAGAWGFGGVAEVVGEAAGLPMRVFHLAPSMCPPFPEFETSAGLSHDSFLSIIIDPACLGMGETYWPSVIDLDPRVGPRFASTLALGKRLGGHAAGARGDKLMAYAASGVGDCHESTTAEEALERLRLGLAVQVREGFIRQEMAAVVPALNALADTRGVMLVTDFPPMDELIAEGAMNVLLKKAVALGVPPARAVAWCSLNPARYYQLDHLGAVAPGWLADLVLVDDLVSFHPGRVWVGGRLVANQGRLLHEPPVYAYPPEARKSIMSPALTLENLRLPAEGKTAKVRVADAINGTITREGQAELAVVAGSLPPDPAQDVQKMAHINRQSKDLRMALGFARGWGLTRGALATTLIWDTCNIFGVGASDAELLLALNRVRELGGGWVVVDGERVVAELPLPICGVISPEPIPAIQAQAYKCEAALKAMGCPMPRPFLTAQTFCFTGLPFLRLTDKGLMDMRRRELVPVILP
jgi:adenine deaminase